MTTPTVPRCTITAVADRSDTRRYLELRRRLYTGDPGYSTTLEFAVESVLTASTAFVRSCHVRPLLATVDGEVVAECMLIHDPALPVLQVAFFEALPGQQDAVDELLEVARAEARARGLNRIIVGLNAHLSIGVGIVTEGFGRASFDSTWNKPYYAGYFHRLERRGLTSYVGSVPAVVERMKPASRQPTPDTAGRSVEVRPLDFHSWHQEMETFRSLCDATLGTTPFYAPTRPGHFDELLTDLKPFLTPENLLFASVGGQEVGFCFWHPDFNEILPAGRRLGVPAMAWRFALRRSRIRTVILNAIGVVPEYRGVATAALLARLARNIDSSFDTYETSFVWDENGASNGMGGYLGNRVLRRFAVWVDPVLPVISTVARATDLPAEWDDVVGDNLYLRRDFLEFMERCDDCGQRYHFIRDTDGRLDTVYMTFERRRYNLSMFTPRDFRVAMTFVYVPLSVTRPGIAWGTCRDEALAHIRSLRGYKLVLNLPPGDYPGFATGLTCAQCVLTLRWATFDAYLGDLRSHYRHRYRKALKASSALRLRFLGAPDEFDEELYRLYLQVVGHSRLVIETLSIDFFRGRWFQIFVLEDDTGPQGFVQLLPNGDELIFEFVGLNYATSHVYDTYERMLLEIVRHGIEHGYRTIDFGQTADDTKLKLGCDYTMLYAALHHSNPVVMFGARRLAPYLQYQPLTTEFQVFKEPPS